MSNGLEREDGEHIIDGDASWEEMLERIGDDDGKPRSERGEDAVAEGEERPAGRETGAADEDRDGVRENGQREEPAADGERKSRREGELPAADDRDRGPKDDTAGKGDDERVVQKRAKRSRKELLDIIGTRENELDAAREELENTKQQIAIKEDKYIRMVAEFENYKKRTRREWELHQMRANAELIKDILGILDDFERAFEATDETGEHFKSGMQLIYAGLLDVLRRVGLAEIEAENRPFDPQYHEALGEVASDEVEEGFVVQVIQKGYMLRDQLLRPAKVIVAKASGM